MLRGLFPIFLTLGLALSGLTAIHALANPSSDANATINSLRASGYRVTVTRIGSGPNCVVQSVNQHSPVTDVANARDMRNRPTHRDVVTHKVAHVTLNCSR